MKSKYTIAVALGMFLVLTATLFGENGLNAKEIDAVRSKEVLNGDDLKIIDDFVAQGVKEMVGTKDFTSISKLRSNILIRSRSDKDSAKTQYSSQFTESAAKYIAAGFTQAAALSDEDRKFKATLNLLILTDNLENLKLLDLAIPMLKDERPVICYWAVHVLTNQAIAAQLNAAKDSKTTNYIIEQLKPLVDAASPEMLSLMVKFAAGVDAVQGEDLLLQIADARMKQYENWTVKGEAVDANILGQLCNKISVEQSKPSVSRRFAQLYSYAIQKYIKGRDFLTPSERDNLATVLVETEKSCIVKLLGMPQTIIKRAVEQEDYTNLAMEHSKLLGDETKAGELGAKLNFDYGKTGSGARTAPLVLPDPPSSEAGK